jgi:hypothetical protein
MRLRSILAPVALSWAALASAAPPAGPVSASPSEFSCALIGKPGTTVLANGVVRKVPQGLDDCEGVKVMAGEATACFIDSTDRRVCRPFGAGSLITRGRLVHGRSVFDGFKELLDILAGDATTAAAILRGGSGIGLPQGPVLLPSQGLQLQLTGNAPPDLLFVEFREESPEGPLVHRLDKPSRRVPLSVKGLRPSTSYFVVVGPQGPGTIPLQFTTASAEEARAIRRALAKLDADKDAGDVGRAFLKADWLQRHGYKFDALQVLLLAGLA